MNQKLHPNRISYIKHHQTLHLKWGCNFNNTHYNQLNKKRKINITIFTNVISSSIGLNVMFHTGLQFSGTEHSGSYVSNAVIKTRLFNVHVT